MSILRAPADASLSIVVPVYRGAATLPNLISRLRSALGPAEFEILLVDDCSPDGSWAVIAQAARVDPRVRGLRLGRNAGQHAALLAGIREARNAIIVTLDDDLQNPPEEIPRLVDHLVRNHLDLVYGTPPRAAQSWWRRLGSRSVRHALSRSMGVSEAAEASSFRAFRTALREGFAGGLGPKISIDALLAWSTSSTGSIPVRHDARDAGRSGYTMRKLLAFSIDTVTGYSTAPLQVALGMGLAVGALGLALMLLVIGRFFLDGSTVPGFTFLAAAITLFSGVQLTTIGIIGEYIARMHFRIMGKPTYHIAEQVGQE